MKYECEIRCLWSIKCHRHPVMLYFLESPARAMFQLLRPVICDTT